MDGQHAAAAHDAAADRRRWFVLAVMVAGQFLFVVDAFIVNVAIPSIRADLGATAAEIAAVVAIYQIVYATLVITGGRLGDIFGRKPMYLLGITGFTLASIGCGLAGSGAILILARLAQGATAALMVPQVLATIHTLFPDAARSRAFGVYGIVLGLGGAVGFVLGGWLTSLDLAGLGWRLVFFVNVPCGLLVALAAMTWMPASVRQPGTKLDIPGAVALFAALNLLIDPVLFGNDVGWAPWLSAMAVAGIVGMWLFLLLERRVTSRGGMPLVDLTLLRDRAFLTGLAAAGCFYFANVSFYLVITLHMQGALGFTPAQSGLALLPLAIAFVLTSRSATMRALRVGPRSLVEGCLAMLGGLACVAALATLTVPSVLAMTLALIPFGIGQGRIMAPLSSLVLAGVPPTQAGSASGVLVTSQQVANAAGVALAGALYFSTLASTTPLAALLATLAGLALAIAATMVFLAQMIPLAGQRT